MALVWCDVRLVILLFCFLSLWHTAAADCLPEPIDIRLGNITLPNYGNNVVRGIDIQLGTPEQQFAFLPQTPLNNSFVYYRGNGLCSSNSLTTKACAVYRGGLYDNTSSSTINSTQPYLHPVKGIGYTGLHFLQDTITFGHNTSMDDYPFGIAQREWEEGEYHPQSALGVGSNSSILNSLKDAGKIASRSWSMFWGLEGATADTQMDGNFVMGGYDKAKTKGEGHKSTIGYSGGDCSTGMMITLTGMDLNFRNGSNSTVFDSQSSPINVCIDPDFPGVMSLPYSLYKRYEYLTQSYTGYRSWGVNHYTMLYKKNNNKFDGDVTFNIMNAGSPYSIQIRNDQLIVPDVSINKNSGRLHANGSTPVLLFNRLPENQTYGYARIGRQFFTGAYLAVNHDAGQYTIWPANPTTEKDIVILDENNEERSSPCSQSTPLATSTSAGEGKSISSGGIAGAVVGSVAGAAIIAGAVFFFIWRKRKAAEAEAENQRASTAESGAGGYGDNKGPLDLTPRIAQELDGNNHKQPHELPAEATRHELSATGSIQRPHELPAKPVAPAELE